jgi:hypothetical protein
MRDSHAALRGATAARRIKDLIGEFAKSDQHLFGARRGNGEAINEVMMPAERTADMMTEISWVSEE